MRRKNRPPLGGFSGLPLPGEPTLGEVLGIDQPSAAGAPTAGVSESADQESPEFRAIVQALEEHERAQNRRRLANLCDRLGIDNSLDEPTRWVLVGVSLAAREPEFQRNRRARGRPKLSGPEETIDAKRATLVVEAAIAFADQPGAPRHRLTDWICKWQRHNLKHRRKSKIPPHEHLPFDGKLKTLQNSVLRGLKIVDFPDDLFPK